MNKFIYYLFFICFLTFSLKAQIILPDFYANDPAQNSLGIGPTAIAVDDNGNFALAWQDWNEYGSPVPAMPRVAVQLFSSNAATVGPLNLFNGESRATIIYLDDYLTGDIDLEFLPNGNLLVAVEHEGLYDSFTTWTWSYEAGIGAVSPAGQIIDLLAGTGVIYWFWAYDLVDNGNMRLDIAPGGSFFATVNGPSYDTDYSAVIIQAFDENANYVGDYFTPHTNDPGPNSNHIFPDIATNGIVHLVVWQDGRQDANYDISAQFYSNSAPIGGNQLVNSGDPAGTFNLIPSVSMNSSGNSVVVWADSRQGLNGEIYGQRYNSSGQTVGNNFQISAGQGAIPPYTRAEVAVRANGSFMIVWTDSIPGVTGIQAYRARARQFNAEGNPTGPPFVLPDQDIPSGYPCVATNGSRYFCSWIDTRFDNVTPNVMAKVVEDINSSVEQIYGDIHSTCWLGDNNPNPFSSSTTIQFSIPYKVHVVIKVMDASGKEIVLLTDEILPPGRYESVFDGTGLTGGVYYYRMEATGRNNGVTNYFLDTGKLILLK